MGLCAGAARGLLDVRLPEGSAGSYPPGMVKSWA